jgi:hypothetical protein
VPRLSCWFIRTALFNLLLGFTVGGLLLWNKGLPFDGNVWRLLPFHVELVAVGWTLQLALGMAFWILPRWGGSRGNEAPAWAAYGLLNSGVLLAGGGAWLGAPAALLAAGRALELLAVLAFVVHAWPRVKPLGG